MVRLRGGLFGMANTRANMSGLGEWHEASTAYHEAATT
jgi:hypothetical protein